MKFEVVSKSKDGKIKQAVDLEVLNGTTVIKRYEVKRLGDSVELDSAGKEKLSQQLIRYIALHPKADFQYVTPDASHARNIVKSLSKDAMDRFEDAFGEPIGREIAEGVWIANTKFFKFVE